MKEFGNCMSPFGKYAGRLTQLQDEFIEHTHISRVKLQVKELAMRTKSIFTGINNSTTATFSVVEQNVLSIISSLNYKSNKSQEAKETRQSKSMNRFISHHRRLISTA